LALALSGTRRFILALAALGKLTQPDRWPFHGQPGLIPKTRLHPPLHRKKATRK